MSQDDGGSFIFDKDANSIENKSMNVLFLASDNDKTSGAFISMVTLVDILRKKYGMNVFVILPHKGDGVELLNDKEIPFKLIYSFSWVIPLEIKDSTIAKIKGRVKRIINYMPIIQISRFIKQNDIDIVHINTTFSYVGAKSALRSKTHLVWHLREFLEQHQNNTLWDRKSGNELINKSDKIIVISDSLKKKYDNVFDEDKLVRIYDSVDDNGFYKPNKEIFNNSTLIFIIVGRVSYPKGQADLAKACSKLYSSGFTNFEVWFVGEEYDNTKTEIVDLFESTKMDNYKFLGHMDNVGELYELADISFTCSEFEALGRTTIEAMFSGNLVIGADSGATTELLNDNRGLLFNLHDSDDLFEKIKFAIDNPEISKKIAESGRKYMVENMGAEKNAEEIVNLYREILNS